MNWQSTVLALTFVANLNNLVSSMKNAPIQEKTLKYSLN